MWGVYQYFEVCSTHLKNGQVLNDVIKETVRIQIYALSSWYYSQCS